MKLELLMKVIDSSDDRDPAEKLAEKVLKDLENDEDDQKKYMYKPYTIDLRDIGVYGMEDDEHTKILLPFGMFYAKVDYFTFSNIYQTATTNMVKTLSDFKMVKR